MLALLRSVREDASWPVPFGRGGRGHGCTRWCCRSCLQRHRRSMYARIDPGKAKLMVCPSLANAPFIDNCCQARPLHRKSCDSSACVRRRCPRPNLSAPSRTRTPACRWFSVRFGGRGMFSRAAADSPLPQYQAVGLKATSWRASRRKLTGVPQQARARHRVTASPRTRKGLSPNSELSTSQII